MHDNIDRYPNDVTEPGYELANFGPQMHPAIRREVAHMIGQASDHIEGKVESMRATVLPQLDSHQKLIGELKEMHSNMQQDMEYMSNAFDSRIAGTESMTKAATDRAKKIEKTVITFQEKQTDLSHAVEQLQTQKKGRMLRIRTVMSVAPSFDPEDDKDKEWIWYMNKLGNFMEALRGDSSEGIAEDAAGTVQEPHETQGECSGESLPPDSSLITGADICFSANVGVSENLGFLGGEDGGAPENMKSIKSDLIEELEAASNEEIPKQITDGAGVSSLLQRLKGAGMAALLQELKSSVTYLSYPQPPRSLRYAGIFFVLILICIFLSFSLSYFTTMVYASIQPAVIMQPAMFPSYRLRRQERITRKGASSYKV
ncbi:hypothetical protein BJ165DRAFT_1530817 [Panaeolus papilionaceus]|nr:hypothetical protein BJ165DRAFT_1530817 [Panaeolus papilionaceus]